MLSNYPSYSGHCMHHKLNKFRVYIILSIVVQKDQERKEETRLNPMTKAPTLTEKSKKQRDNI